MVVAGELIRTEPLASAEVVLGSRIGDLSSDSKIRPIFML